MSFCCIRSSSGVIYIEGKTDLIILVLKFTHENRDSKKQMSTFKAVITMIGQIKQNHFIAPVGCSGAD